MLELVSKIAVCLLLAAAVGLVVGWLLHRLLARDRAAALAGELARLRARAGSARPPDAAHDGDAAALRRERDAAEQRRAGQAADLRGAQDGRARAEAALADLQRQHAALREAHERRGTEFELLGARLATTEAMLREAGDKLAAETAAARAAAAQAASLTRALESERSHHGAEEAATLSRQHQIEESLAAVRGQLQQALAAQDEAITHRRELDVVRRDLETARAQAAEYEQVVEQARRQVADAAAEAQRQRAAADDATRAAAESAARMRAAETRALEARARGEALQADLEQLRGDLHTVVVRAQRADAAEAELAAVRARVTELEDRSRDLATIYGELRAARVRIAELEPLAQRLPAADAAVVELRGRLAALENAAASAPAAAAAGPRDAPAPAAAPLPAGAPAAAMPAAAAAPAPSDAPSATPPAAPRRRAHAPLPDGADDLQQIFGIGPVLEQKLHALGITRFRQIALWSPEDIHRIDAQLENFHGRIERDHWVQGAREQHLKKYGESL